MIDVTGVHHHYGVRPVLREIDLRVESATLAAIIGPNGSGKTTLLGAMAGVLAPYKGHVEIDGLRRRSSVENELEIRRRAVYLPDSPWMPGQLTGREFLLAVGELYGIEADRLFDHVERLLVLFGLVELADSPIRSYSAGQHKKTGLCAALVTDAPVLLLDEPFSGGLDPSGILALKRVLRRLVEDRQATIVLSTPVPELVEQIADRLVILREGRIAADGSLAELRQLTGRLGPLEEVLESLLSSETSGHIDQYFERTA